MDAHNLPPHRSIGHAALPRRKKRARTTTTSRRNETIGLQNKKKRTRRGNVARRPPETARSCVTDRGAVAWPMAEMKKNNNKIQQKTTPNHQNPIGSIRGTPSVCVAGAQVAQLLFEPCRWPKMTSLSLDSQSAMKKRVPTCLLPPSSTRTCTLVLGACWLVRTGVQLVGRSRRMAIGREPARPTCRTRPARCHWLKPVRRRRQRKQRKKSIERKTEGYFL